MRHPIFHILLIAILLTMAFPFHSSGSEKEIDFNFPQDVSKTALADLGHFHSIHQAVRRRLTSISRKT